METYHLTMATKNIEWHPIIDNTNRVVPTQLSLV